jgi:hypothetical protein
MYIVARVKSTVGPWTCPAVSSRSMYLGNQVYGSFKLPNVSSTSKTRFPSLFCPAWTATLACRWKGQEISRHFLGCFAVCPWPYFYAPPLCMWSSFGQHPALYPILILLHQHAMAAPSSCVLAVLCIIFVLFKKWTLRCRLTALVAVKWMYLFLMLCMTALFRCEKIFGFHYCSTFVCLW